MSRRSRGNRLFFALALAGAVATRSAAQEESPRDVPAVAEAPVVDGVLDDAAWTGALLVDDFVARQPVAGAAPTMRTEVRLVHTERALYVALRAFDPRPETIRSSAARRDDFAISAGDQFAIAIDSFRDRRNGYWFSTDPVGARVDGQFSDEGDRFDDAWNGVWQAAARIDRQGWTAEVAIPFATMRFREAAEVVMGINLFRRIPRTNEQVFSPAIPLVYANGTPNVSVARAFRFRGIGGGARFDVRPFALAALERGAGAGERSLDGGLFARVPLTDAVTLSGALRADFSEVEADEDRLNLTRFPLFVPEKRDFFLENAGLFAFGVPGEAELFFSRTIGLVAGPDGADETVPIAWGAKATGRAGPVEFGLLSGATSEVSGASAERFDVARARVALGARSTIGGFWSRRGSDAIGARSTFGADFSHFFPGEIRVQGFAARTAGAGEGAGGFFAALSRGGERTAFTLSVLDLSAGFAPALGLLARPGTRRLEGSVVLPWFAGDASPVRRVAPGLSFVRYDDHEGAGFDEREALSLAARSKKDENVAAELVRERERLTAPFPLYRDVTVAAGTYERWEAGLTATSDPARTVSGEVQLRAGSLYGGRHVFARAEGVFRPGPLLTLAPALLADRVDLPGASFTAWVARARLGVAAGAKVSFDLLGQYESERRGAGIGVRARYDVREGTQVLVAWDSVELREAPLLSRAAAGTGPLRTARAAVKCSYLLLF